MSPLDLWTKALNAAASARTLLRSGDGSGATSRAYYAMLNAARALLWLRDLAVARARVEAMDRFIAVLTALKEQSP